jgi:hypothetical protein
MDLRLTACTIRNRAQGPNDTTSHLHRPAAVWSPLHTSFGKARASSGMPVVIVGSVDDCERVGNVNRIDARAMIGAVSSFARQMKS